MNEPHLEILLDVLAREGRSLLSYIGDAYPWTTSANESALGTLRKAVLAEKAAVNALGRYLVRQRLATPQSGAYPASFTSMNFVALSYLLPRLLDAQRQGVTALEADLKRVPPDSRQPLESLLTAKRATLVVLEEMSTPRPATVSA